MLTVGIGGGEHLDVWLNGRQLASVKTRLTFGRYGCSEALRAHASINCSSTWTSGRRELAVDPRDAWRRAVVLLLADAHPVPSFWEQLRRDFPAAQNPLLDLVHADWFETPGWFASPGSQFEEQLIDLLAGECGDEEASIRAELEQLKQAKAARDDRRWLDLCVQARCSPRSAAISPGSAPRSRHSADRVRGEYPACDCWSDWTTASSGWRPGRRNGSIRRRSDAFAAGRAAAPAAPRCWWT